MSQEELTGISIDDSLDALDSVVEYLEASGCYTRELRGRIAELTKALTKLETEVRGD